MRKLKFASIAVFAVLVAAVAWQINEVRSGNRKMLALLNGDAGVEITRFTSRYQQRRVECTDPDVLQYLKTMMVKHHSRYMRIGDFTYEGNFEFGGGGRFIGTMIISTNGFDLTAVPNMDDIPTHSVALADPVPEKVRLLFGFFDEPWQTAAGKVLILDQGKTPRTNYDSALVAR